MKAKDMLGTLLILAGVTLCVLAWGMRSFWWGIVAALLLTAGFCLVRKREREEDLADVAAGLHERGLGWRIWMRRRRIDGDGDGDGDGDRGVPDFGDD